MKKVIALLVLITQITTAEAVSLLPKSMIGQYDKIDTSYYSNDYKTGYEHGKEHERKEIAKKGVIIGVAVIASIAIYQLGKNSNWTVSQNGVGYRF